MGIFQHIKMQLEKLRSQRHNTVTVETPLTLDEIQHSQRVDRFLDLYNSLIASNSITEPVDRTTAEHFVSLVNVLSGSIRDYEIAMLFSYESNKATFGTRALEDEIAYVENICQKTFNNGLGELCDRLSLNFEIAKTAIETIDQVVVLPDFP